MCDDVVTRGIETEDTYRLRSAVLRPNRPLETCFFSGDDESSTVHFGAFQNDRLIGIASLYNVPCGAMGDRSGLQIRGMAVEPEVRGLGFGRCLVNRCIQHSRRGATNLVWCNARSTAVEFYRELGFKTVGNEFEIPEVGPHLVMVYDTNKDVSDGALS